MGATKADITESKQPRYHISIATKNGGSSSFAYSVAEVVDEVTDALLKSTTKEIHVHVR